MDQNKTKKGDRVRYFPNIWNEDDYYDGTVVDNEGTVAFDDGYEAVDRTDQDAAFLLSGDELREMGVNYDEEKNQFTSRKKQ